MDNLEKYVDNCIDSMLKRYSVDDLRDRVFFALGYMDDNAEVKKLLWSIAYGDKMGDGHEK